MSGHGARTPPGGEVGQSLACVPHGDTHSGTRDRVQSLGRACDCEHKAPQSNRDFPQEKRRLGQRASWEQSQGAMKTWTAETRPQLVFGTVSCPRVSDQTSPRRLRRPSEGHRGRLCRVTSAPRDVCAAGHRQRPHVDTGLERCLLVLTANRNARFDEMPRCLGGSLSSGLRLQAFV